MKQDNKRFQQALGLALGVHLAAAALLGAYFWTPLFKPNDKIIEVALAGAPPKKKAAKTIVKPKPIIKPKADDIVDKRIKPPEPQPETTQQETPDTDDDNNSTEGTTSEVEGNGGTGNQPTESTGQAVQLPYITYSTTPPYPQEARKNSVEGTVHIKVLIDINGRVSSASVVSSSGSSLLDNSALQAVYKWRFSPAKDASGKKVQCYVNIPIVYKIKK